jgi:hypothetical protein
MKIGPIVATVLFIVLFGFAWWVYSPGPAITPVPEKTQSQGWSTYATSTFSIQYPSDYTPDASYTHDIAPGRVSRGVAFIIPASLTEGTNLSKDSYISVETIPELSSCHAAQYTMQMPVSGGPDIVDDGVEYSLATTTTAGAGNLYEETLYVRQDQGPCLAIRYSIHSTNIGNYAPGTVEEFDKDSLLSEFDRIRRTLTRE